MTNKEKIFSILELYFQFRTICFNRNTIPCKIDNLIESDIIHVVDGAQIKINLESDRIYEVLLEYITDKLKKELPQSVGEAYIWVEEFEEKQKAEYGFSHIVNAYSEVIEKLKSYILYLFCNKGIIEIKDFAGSLDEDKKWDNEKYILDVLLKVHKETGELYEILSLLKEAEYPGRIAEFCHNMGLIRLEEARKLYVFAKGKKDRNDFYILANLLRGIFESEPEWVLGEIRNLLPGWSVLGYFVLGRVNYKNEIFISESIKLAGNFDQHDVEGSLQLPYFYRAAIENPNTSSILRNECFAKLEELFLIGGESLQNSVFQSCSLIEGFEQERYTLLIKVFLGKSQLFYNRIGQYFSTFKSCDYFFDLFINLVGIRYENNFGDLIDAGVFEEAFVHFWKKDKEHTELHLLELLSHDIPCLRIAAVSLIRSKLSGFYQVDLTKLDTEKKQLRALEVLFYNCYFNIGEFLPLILMLRVSPFQEVVTYMQQRLVKLIFHSYHDYLYHKVSELVEEEVFLAPLKQGLEDYHKMRKMKTAIQDLDPVKNERDFMDLYYRLEHEEHQKIMHKSNADENSILSLARQVIIVRGNAWKIGDNPVSPLGKVECAFVLDQKMFKNPDLFDYTHRCFTSEF